MADRRPHRVVTFGDLLLRLNPPGFERLVQAGTFEVRYTGAEANVAAMLASLGAEASAVSRVPANDIGQACVNYLRRFGIDTRHILRGGDRLGIFYLEAGASQRASKVIYDRKNSSFAGIQPSDFDWENVFSGAQWFHFSGTAPATGEGVVATLHQALVTAKSLGVRVSCDLNYRSQLWAPDEAGRIMSGLMPYVEVLIGNEEDAVTVFGLDPGGTDVAQGKLDMASYRDVATQLRARFGLGYVATTLRKSVSASANIWSAMVFDGEKHYVSREYEILPIVDRVGAGDSFSAGLIFGLLQDWPPQRCVEFAAAASCLKHSVPGDFNLVSLSEVEALVGGEGSGRIRR